MIEFEPHIGISSSAGLRYYGCWYDNIQGCHCIFQSYNTKNYVLVRSPLDNLSDVGADACLECMHLHHIAFQNVCRSELDNGVSPQ